MTWNKKDDKWCPENDGAYRAEQAAIHGGIAWRCHSCGKFTSGSQLSQFENHLYCDNCSNSTPSEVTYDIAREQHNCGPVTEDE